MSARPTDPTPPAEQTGARAATARYAPVESRALGVMAVLAILILLWVLVPVGVGVLLGATLGLAVYPLHQKIVRRTRRPVLVCVGTTVVATIAVTGTLGALLLVLVLRGMSVLSGVPQWFAPGGEVTLLFQRLAHPLAAFRVQPEELEEKLRGAFGSIASSLAGWAAQFLSAVFEGALAIFFMALTMYFVLRHWTEIAKRAERLMPINPHHTRRLMREIRRLGRTVLVGNFGTAIVQGIVAGIGYAIAGIHEWALLAAVTAVASLLPAVGTLLVWVPVGLTLLFGGQTGRGIFELAWGAIMVGVLCDYVIRPKLVGRGDTTSTWMTFVALFGGLKLFGFVGFLLGPLLVGIAVAVLTVYERTRRFRLALG